MATLATAAGVFPNRWSSVYFNDHDTASDWGKYGSVSMTDDTFVFMDNGYQLNFTGPSRSSIVRINPSLNNVSWVGIVRDVLDNLVIVWADSSALSLRVLRYNKPASGWGPWVADGSRPALVVGLNTTPTNLSNIGTDSPGHINGVSGIHVAKVANITNGALVVTWQCTSRGDGNYEYYIGYSVNLTTGSVISRGTVHNTSYYYPVLAQPAASAPYGHGNPRHGSWMGVLSQQPYPFAPYIWQGSKYTQGNYGQYFDANDENARSAGQYGHVWARIDVDANGNITAPNYYYTNSGGQGSKRTWDTTVGGASYAGGFSIRSTHAPSNLAGSWGQDILVSSIFQSKPLIWDQSGTRKWSWSTQPTGFVFNTQFACPIHWIPDRNVLRMFGSNGTSLTYIDITWDGTNFTFPASATVVEPTGAAINFRINNMPIFTQQDAHYSTSLSYGISTGSSTSYSYVGTSGSFPEPYVSTLKANNGMKFIFNSNAVNTDYQSSFYVDGGNYKPLKGTDTFQFKRVHSGGTDYYNFTTNTWTSSVVNNASTFFPGGGGSIPSGTSTHTLDVAGSWADNTSYTYSLLYTDVNSITVPSLTKTIATPPVSAAPTSPTPRRLFVFTLQNRTSSHVLSIENRVLINKVNLVNQSANSVGVTLNLGGYNFLSTVTLAPYQTAQFETAVIANVAERLLVTCTADASVDMWIMGTEGV